MWSQNGPADVVSQNGPADVVRVSDLETRVMGSVDPPPEERDLPIHEEASVAESVVPPKPPESSVREIYRSRSGRPVVPPKRLVEE